MPCTNMKIIDNFLDGEDFKRLRNFILSDSIQWVFRDNKVEEGDQKIQFVHLLWDKEKGFCTNHSQEILNLFKDQLNCWVWIHSKINLTLARSPAEATKYHIDLRNLNPGLKTAIFYLTSTDGPTLFRGERVVECVENRMVIFDTCLHHAGCYHSDFSTPRVVINFNFLEKGE